MRGRFRRACASRPDFRKALMILLKNLQY
jgi:hypothetical protein